VTVEIDTPLVSADSHVVEPPDLWTSRVDSTWRDRAPRVVRGADGNDWWWVDDFRTNSFAGGTQAGRRFDAPGTLVLADQYDNVPVEVQDPNSYVEANLRDGVVASVLYPTQHLVHYKVRNSELLTECCRAYNDWLAEFCGAAAGHLRGIAALNVDDVDTAVAEAERAAKLGLAGLLVPVSLPRGDTYADPAYDALWAVAAANRLPVCLHIGTDRADWRRAGAPVVPGTSSRSGGPVLTAFVLADHYVRRTLADLVFGGVLERHPELRVGSIEHEAGWAPYFVDRLDYTYTERATKGHRFADGRVPSDFVRSQVFITLSEDAIAVRERASLGEDTLMWASDFPHSESTYPRSRELAARLTEGTTERERRAITAGSAAALFDIDLRTHGVSVR
jgi:predicted TIM-barrel fold metal-dependent hydrolase